MAPELAVRTFLIGMTIPFLHVIFRELTGFELPLAAWLIAAAALWLPMTIGLYIRAREPMPSQWRRLSRVQRIRRLAGALWITPVAMLFPLWVGLLYEPSGLIEYWDLFALFFGLPFATSIALYLYSARNDHPAPLR